MNKLLKVGEFLICLLIVILFSCLSIIFMFSQNYDNDSQKLFDMISLFCICYFTITVIYNK